MRYKNLTTFWGLGIMACGALSLSLSRHLGEAVELASSDILTSWRKPTACGLDSSNRINYLRLRRRSYEVMRPKPGVDLAVRDNER